ncbi:MAG: transcriptional regulator [Flavobacteriales bacterium]|jgi:DNA-binding transcriptional MerR regulator|nr:transcriptional regulator [Flavobacteriales bacterium]|tara:strand:- start:1412 stop:1732 length:321 start_codon:yes stop_codon:yes gene_type:complete
MPTEKLFYKISEAAEMFSVNISAIRFWEKEFEILKPKKNKKGNRLFTPKDIKNLKIIYHLLKERGFTVEGAKKKLKENKTDTINNIEIVSHLKDIRGFLVNLRKEL